MSASGGAVAGGDQAGPGYETSIDPIQFSVLLGRFNSIVNEMSLTLEYSASTSILALCHDFSCAIYDAEGRQLSMHDALPSHTASLELVLKEMIRSHEGKIADGDVIMCNDPYRYNSHIGDLVTATPVMAGDRILFWSVAKGHQMDTGAFIPSSVCATAENVWQEGFRIPPIKIVEAGEIREDLLELYLTNMRYAELLKGDLLAQLGSIETGRKRLLELIDESGPELLLQYIDEVIAYSDRRTSQELSAMPDGVYTGEGWVDTDGFDKEDIPIKVKVTLEGDEVTVDLTGSGPQVRGGVNGSLATTIAAATIPFLFYIDSDIPHNHGCLKHVKVVAPEGTIVNAEFPGSTSAATIVPSDAIHDAVNKAMAEALPDRVPAGGARCNNVLQLAGVDSETGRPWGVMVFNNTAGSGGCKGADGWPLWESVCCAGAIKVQPVEQLELLYPILVNEMEIAPDSMGFGEYIGGPGTRCSITPLRGEMEVMTFGDGYDNPPHGVLGGTAGIGGGMYVEGPDGGPRTFLSATAAVTVPEGHELFGESSGGGGWGSPLGRPIERVVEDVLNEIISREAAARHFGVVVRDDGSLDEEETRRRRDELAREERPLITPVVPHAATWRQEIMREGDVYETNL